MRNLQGELSADASVFEVTLMEDITMWGEFIKIP